MTEADELPALHVVGANPALDRLQVVEAFAPFGVNRASEVVRRAGGKSLIVARAIRRLGGDVTLHGFLGGPVAEVIAAECRAEGIRDRHVRIAGETRTTVVIVEAGSGRTTVVNEPGPEIDDDELALFEATLFGDLRPGDLLVLTGSLPRGVPADLYATVIARAKAAGAVALLDTSGQPLVRALAAGPDVLKVNAHEFEQLFPESVGHDGYDLVGAMDLMRRRYDIGTVIVTRGSRGCLAVDRDHLYTVSAPVVETVNATGSGDSFFGALALSLAGQTALGPPAFAEALRLGTAAGAANAVRLDPDVGELADVMRLVDAVDVQVSDVAAGVVPTLPAGHP